MPYDHPKLNFLDRGWYVVFKDGTVTTEEEMAWIEVPNKKDIKLVGMKRHNKYYELEGKESYLPPGESHMRELAINSGEGMNVTRQTLVGWFIGYYDKTEKVYLRVDADTGKVWEERVPYAAISI